MENNEKREILETLRSQKKPGFLQGQVATETLLIIGFLFLFLIPLLVFVFGILSADSWKLDTVQAKATATRLVNVANKVALGGEGTSTVETVFIPSSVSEIAVNGSELIFKINTQDLGVIEEVAIADVQLVLNPAAPNNWTQVKGTSVFVINYSGGKVWLSR